MGSDQLAIPPHSVTLRARLAGWRIAWFVTWRRDPAGDLAILAGLRFRRATAATIAFNP